MKTESIAKLCASICTIAALLSCQTASSTKELASSSSEKQSYELKFKYVQGNDYSYSSEIREKVFVDGSFQHSALITNSISIHIAEIQERKARILSTVTVTERISPLGKKPFQEIVEYQTELWRDELGKIEIGADKFMPVVRDVPVFPKKLIFQGESWSAPTEEAHDFRRGSIENPVHVPFTANYKLEQIERDSTIAVISVNYRIDSHVSIDSKPSVYPIRMSGYSKQKLRWNIKLGLIEFSDEMFSFTVHFSDAQTVRYSGKAKITRLK